MGKNKIHTWIIIFFLLVAGSSFFIPSHLYKALQANIAQTNMSLTIIGCGDNIKQLALDEECDGTDLGGLTCQDYGFKHGTLSCSQNCKISTSSCHGGGSSSGGGGSPFLHTECYQQMCVIVVGPGRNDCYNMADCRNNNTNSPSTHTECLFQMCVPVIGEGINQCSSHRDCQQNTNSTPFIRSKCVHEMCVPFPEQGANECTTSSDCQSNSNTNGTSQHSVCQHNKCVLKPGQGKSQCSTDRDCTDNKEKEIHFILDIDTDDSLNFNYNGTTSLHPSGDIGEKIDTDSFISRFFRFFQVSKHSLLTYIRQTLSQKTPSYHASAPHILFDYIPVWIISFILAIFLMIIGWFLFLIGKKTSSDEVQRLRIHINKSTKSIFKRRFKGIGIWSMVLLFSITAFSPPTTQATSTTPNTIIYEGRLLDNTGKAIQTPRTFRFSFWKSTDWISTDRNTNGSINTTSSLFGGWQEIQNVSFNSTGVFSVKLGIVTPLPAIDFDLHKYLQVEVKNQDAPDTDYQLMDVTGDNGVDTTDRQIIGSSPYAKNSEQLQNKTIGLQENNLATLGQDGKWLESQIPGGTTDPKFILDYNNSITGSGSIKLQFGQILDKYIAYDTDNHWFYFNDDVLINGKLMIVGDSISLGDKKLTFSASGITGTRTITFNDADTIVVGENNIQTLTNKSINGDNNTLTNIDWSSLKNRSKTIILNPQFTGMVIDQDGTNNIADLNAGKDETTQEQYYVLSTAQNTLQDLDLIISVKLPDDFVSWQTIPMQLLVKSSSINAADNQIDLTIQDTSNSPVTILDGTNLLGSVSPHWETKNISFSGSPTWTPGEIVTLRLKLQAKDQHRIFIGRIKFNYNGK